MRLFATKENHIQPEFFQTPNRKSHLPTANKIPNYKSQTSNLQATCNLKQFPKLVTCNLYPESSIRIPALGIRMHQINLFSCNAFSLPQLKWENLASKELDQREYFLPNPKPDCIENILGLCEVL